MRGRADAALRHLERAQIGTIHGFAASLLRLYPLETGLDPGFREGDERLLRRHFDISWGLWLDGELSSTRAENRGVEARARALSPGADR